MVLWSDIKILSFDCYGTLIDWETGILSALIPVLRSHDIAATDADVLELYAAWERKAEEGSFIDYKSVLRLVMDGFAERFRFKPGAGERDCLIQSLKHWMPFPDTVSSLSALKSRFRLAIISNVDDDLFSFTHQRLGVRFDWVITAEQVRSYKPSFNNFNTAIQRFGVPMNQVVHVAQSKYHDIEPANRLGLSSVWVNRRQEKTGAGATTPAQAIPDVVVPDLRSLVELVGIEDDQANKMV